MSRLAERQVVSLGLSAKGYQLSQRFAAMLNYKTQPLVRSSTAQPPGYRCPVQYWTQQATQVA